MVSGVRTEGEREDGTCRHHKRYFVSVADVQPLPVHAFGPAQIVRAWRRWGELEEVGVKTINRRKEKRIGYGERGGKSFGTTSLGR